jgi:hypothetical protein
LGTINANSIIRTKNSANSSATNLSGYISDTYAMLTSRINAYITGNGKEYMFLLRKNTDTAEVVTTTYSSTTTYSTIKNIKDFLKFLNLDGAAPQVLQTLSNSLDSFMYRQGYEYNYFYFKNNTKNILERLIAISNQSNPLIQYEVQQYKFYRDRITVVLRKRNYTIKTAPLCYAIPIVGKLPTATTLLTDMGITYGDVLTLYIGTASTINTQIKLQNNLLLDFS